MRGRRLVEQAGFLTAGHLMAAVLNLATNVAMARCLGPASYGIVALSLAYPSLIWSLASVKSSPVITRYIAGFRAKGAETEVRAVVKLGYLVDFGLALAAVGIVIMTAAWMGARVSEQPGVSVAMAVYAASFPWFSLFATASAVLAAEGLFLRISVVEVVAACIKLILVVLFLASGAGILGAVSALALAQAATGLLAFTAAQRALGARGSGSWWGVRLSVLAGFRGELSRFFSWNYVLVSLNGVAVQVPIMLLARAGGAAEAGFYRLGLQLTVVGSYVISALERVVYPEIATRMAEAEGVCAKLPWGTWSWKVGLPLGVLMLATVPLCPWFVPLLLGESYRPAAAAIQVFLAARAMTLPLFWLKPLYYAWGAVRGWVSGYGASVIGMLAVLAIFGVEKSWHLAAVFGGADMLFQLGMLLGAARRLGWGWTPGRRWGRRPGGGGGTVPPAEGDRVDPPDGVRRERARYPSEPATG